MYKEYFKIFSIFLFELLINSNKFLSLSIQDNLTLLADKINQSTQAPIEENEFCENSNVIKLIF